MANLTVVYDEDGNPVDDVGGVAVYDDQGRKVCGAWRRGLGSRCGAWPLQGRNRCYHHGGLSPVGSLSPSFRHGRYSKHLPQRLAERYIDSTTDELLLSLRDEIAVIDARITDLMSRLSGGESASMLKALRDQWRIYENALQTGDRQTAVASLGEVGLLIKAGWSDYAAWNDITSLFENRRRLVETEMKHIVHLRQTMKVDEAVSLAYALLDAVKSQVQDRQVLSAINDEFARLLHRDN